MVTQNWVSQAGKRRFSMSYCPEQTPHTTVGALLLPGFLEPMCDTDYFMSKLAKKLYHSGIYAVSYTHLFNWNYAFAYLPFTNI